MPTGPTERRSTLVLHPVLCLSRTILALLVARTPLCTLIFGVDGAGGQPCTADFQTVQEVLGDKNSV